ncbi:MAG: FkbM family methyltransferase [Beijerinckiaceae bacterium]|nr:FkbM family methyltransferase [Beijerinckiaceae bacterium]
MLEKVRSTLRRAIRGFGFDVVRYKSYDPDSVLEGKIVSWKENDVRVRFFVENQHDLIQGEHLKQGFYERDELELIQRAFNGGTFVDIGANVGNHTIYAALILGATKVIAIEPNPAAQRILRVNISINDQHDRVVLHPVGLSDAAGHANIGRTKVGNLGNTELERNDSHGEIKLLTGDEVLNGTKVDFIKIDTEGNELNILKGLSKTIERDRPPLFVEVDNANAAKFHEFIRACGYSVEKRYRRYDESENFLAVPEKPSTM